MKNLKHILLCLLTAMLLLTLAACGSEPKIHVDEQGLASWSPIRGAVQYEYSIVDTMNVSTGAEFTTETSVQLPRGYSLHVRAVYENGKTGDWGISEYFGGMEAMDPAEVSSLVDLSFDVHWGDLKSYRLAENIDYASVQTMDDGSVCFSAAAPNGGEMRFWGQGVTVSEGELCFESGGRILALDAIGRICAYKPVVSDVGTEAAYFDFTGAYTFNGETSADSAGELFEVWPRGIEVRTAQKESYEGSSMMDAQPNMIGFGASKLGDGFAVSDLIVYYDELSYATPLKEVYLSPEFYGCYLEGEVYDPAKEVYDPESEVFTFYLMLLPELQGEREPKATSILVDEMFYMARAVIDIPMERYTLGELKDAEGRVMDKAGEGLRMGSTLEIEFDTGIAAEIQLPVVQRFYGAQTLHDLIPYSNVPAQGDVTALVVPIAWPDCPEEATEELLGELREKLGRVTDDAGRVTDYSGSGVDGFSLSAYYDAVSGGDYRIESYITDWYPAEEDFALMLDRDITAEEGVPEQIVDWLRQTRPDMDWSRFDRNADGMLDSVILLSAGSEQETIFMGGYGGAVRVGRGYIPKQAADPQKPEIKDFILVSAQMLKEKNTLLHEYAHNFGLIDYYDVTYSGIDAVGGFDMESSNLGDWNAYSKYAAGWIEPHVIQGLAAGESVEITIGAQWATGDAIVIPAADTAFDGPFGEYMLVDLFSGGGVNEYDSAEAGLSTAAGVRIYHVNAIMERRELTDDQGGVFPIGTPHRVNALEPSGRYHIELLQRGGNNTFTDLKELRTQLWPEDLFVAGDVFDAADYGQFLVDGRMDDGSEFGYTIEVVAADKESATVCITRK